jgi:hypothetical protein
MAVIMGERDFTAFEVLIGRLEGERKSSVSNAFARSRNE